MNTFVTSMKTVAVGVALLAITACATVAPKPEGAALVREKLTHLQADFQLASRAPVEIKEAEASVSAAEQPEKDMGLSKHRILLADRMVDIAVARAQSRLLVDQRKGLSEQSDKARLDARTQEADMARNEAITARNQAETSRNQASEARDQANAARDQANAARNDAALAKTEATNARLEAESARMDTAKARSDSHESALQSAELKKQIAELNAKTTDRGLVMTLGDVLFSTNMSDLKEGSAANLNKLVAFLIKYDDRTLVIEGHTDNVGSVDYNQALSQRRADSVKNYLIGQNISISRLSAYGKGESSPVSDNETATGRQMNRRVEIIISNTVVAAN